MGTSTLVTPPPPAVPVGTGAPGRLDVLIPSHNRATLLVRAVRSVLAADPVPGLDVHVTVILNGCTDRSADRMTALEGDAAGRLTVLQDRRRGKSLALNAGIAATSGHLVGMIDDDEEVDSQWVRVAWDAFQDPELEFTGGPYVPCWDAPPPAWVPADYLAVLGSADCGAVEREYGPHFPGILKGGNAIIRRRTLERVGPYLAHLGPGAYSRLFSCEDEEMYLRLLAAGAKGRYLPRLIVYHQVSVARLTPDYYRRWCFWRGVSRGVMDPLHPLPVSYLGGIPRFLFGHAARAALRLAAGVARPLPPPVKLAEELKIWDLAGYLYGRHVYPLRRFSRFEDRRAPAPPAGAPHGTVAGVAAAKTNVPA